MPLSETEKAMLDFEGGFWRYAGAKEQAIRDQFDLTPTRFYQQLNALLENPAALAYNPTVVNRLRRRRDTRRQARAQRGA